MTLRKSNFFFALGRCIESRQQEIVIRYGAPPNLKLWHTRLEIRSQRTTGPKNNILRKHSNAQQYVSNETLYYDLCIEAVEETVEELARRLTARKITQPP